MVKKNTCVFISGTGTNLKNLIKKTREYNFPINIKLIVSNNSKAQGIKYAKNNRIPLLLINTKLRNFENKLINELKKHKISLICLAGYMRILSKNFILSFRKKIINIHPSLLPKFKGLDTFNRILKEKEVVTGCTVHFVNEKLDSGKIIIKKRFYINPKDGIEDLKNKTQKLEYCAFPEAIIKMYRIN
tara:strand:+ start:1990 stop:2553 length:564 start_codon:yes stop_codon:yes gene_type:complete